MKPTGVVLGIAGFALALVLLGGVTWLNLSRASEAQESARLVERAHEVRYELRGLFALLRDVDAGSSSKAIATRVERLRALIVDPQQQQSLTALEALIAQGAMRDARVHLAMMDKVQDQLLADRAMVAQRDTEAARTLTLAGSGISVALLIGVFALMMRENRMRESATSELRRSLGAIGAMQDAVFMYAPDTLRFFFANDGATRQLGYSRDELLRMTPLDLRPSFTEAEYRAMLAPLLDGRAASHHFTTVHRHKDGNDVPVEVVLQVVGEGAERCFVGLSRDVSEREKAEAAVRASQHELEAANRQLDQAARLKDEFLANMSHELRTPLNAILGLSESLLEQVGGTLTPRQEKSIATIASSGSHLLALINDILDLSKVEAGKLDVYAERIELDDFCQSCLTFVRTQAMQKDIAISFDSGDAPDAIHADPKRLKQILVNLLTNAVKFTPKGGRVGLMVSAPAGEGRVRFTVHDSGIGIAPGDQGKLFKAFSQVDSGLSRSQEGTGLGLVLVARLAELQGGSVAVESEAGRGSRFIVTLPLTASAAAGDSASEDRRNYRKALVIEDDPSTGERLTQYLSELGVDSVLQVRGDLALEAARRECPDVILLDLQLPGESGWVVLARLKDDPETARIPVMVVSVIDDPARSLALGAVAHFTKPITRQQLGEFFQRSIERPVTAGVVDRAPESGGGPVVLLAEDNEANVLTMGGYLEDKGYTLRYAVNGVEAVARAHEVRPAVILMDIQMPVMDGLTAIAEIRKDAGLRAIPIVALTALAMPGDRERCIAAGATDYLTKPVSLKGLAELVARLAPPVIGARA
jgi:PAS domain S-box-containing protein